MRVTHTLFTLALTLERSSSQPLTASLGIGRAVTEPACSVQVFASSWQWQALRRHALCSRSAPLLRRELVP